MTLRTNEIGADVYSQTETELDKSNLDVKQNETEKHRAFPELEPGRALINAATGELIEFHHQMMGFVDTVEGRLAGYEEYINEEYGTPEGQDWGGIIEHFFIAMTRRPCPTPNQHGEIHVPIHRPAEEEIIDMKPERFKETVLFDDNNRANPLLVVERPQATYGEIAAGDTFEVEGWYDPRESPGERIKPVNEMGAQHPEINGIDYTTTTRKQFNTETINASVDWDSQTSDAAIRFTADNDDSISVTENTNRSDVHIDIESIGNVGTQLLIDAPYSMKRVLDDLSCDAKWSGRHRVYHTDATSDAIAELLIEFVRDGEPVTMDADVVDELFTTNVDVIPDENVEVTVDDVLEYTFTVEHEVGTQTSIPGVSASIDLSETTASDIVTVMANDSVEASITDEAAENHVISVSNDTFEFDCPKKNGSIVKSLPWKEARYDFNQGKNTWDIKTDFVAETISLFVEQGNNVSITVGALMVAGDDETVVETEEINVDSDSIVGINTYDSASDDENVTLDISRENEAAVSDVFGVTSPSENASLLNLELTTTTDHSASMDLNIGGNELDEVPSSVIEQWNTTSDPDEVDTYEWYNPRTSARIRVVEVDGWGSEFDVYVETPQADELENICRIADEKRTTLEVIKHLKALTGQ